MGFAWGYSEMRPALAIGSEKKHRRALNID
jgi:hypothetical protein